MICCTAWKIYRLIGRFVRFYENFRNETDGRVTKYGDDAMFGWSSIIIYAAYISDFFDTIPGIVSQACRG